MAFTMAYPNFKKGLKMAFGPLVLTFIQSIKILHINYDSSCLYITPHSTFYIVNGCVEHRGTQVLIYGFSKWIFSIYNPVDEVLGEGFSRRISKAFLVVIVVSCIQSIHIQM
jgi:hypothetical protein